MREKLLQIHVLNWRVIYEIQGRELLYRVGVSCGCPDPVPPHQIYESTRHSEGHAIEPSSLEFGKKMPSIMSAPSSISSSTKSTSSREMLSRPSSPLSSHPFLSPNRASTISSWTLSLPERESRPCDDEALSRDTAIEAYRQLKLALFSRSQTSSKLKAEHPKT
ncbi:hypothetical protein K458DRAFT_21533 [Lentithecium fluviatile CBS 122367]|uniref:Uncharacterized protein n=1 Tax=Lentithecium fluviatile CBS 122367 TaxID=1168545 RepID=A0A6G1J3X2_9PLEO|nr:hypothetical protein K458DRAFT_21533 [Lentithecium fluviatile CBS 122367]